MRPVVNSLPLVAIVDDEESIRRALLRLLRSAGIEAQAFPSGAAFLESLQTHEPDCVVLDLNMPGMTGFEVQTRLGQGWPDIPVIIVTGHHSTETYARSILMRPCAYLLKPMDDQALLDAIEKALRQRASAGHSSDAADRATP